MEINIQESTPNKAYIYGYELETANTINIDSEMNVDCSVLVPENMIISDIKKYVFVVPSRKLIFRGGNMSPFTKQPSEVFPISIDFSDVLDTSEIITSITVTAYLIDVDVTSQVIDLNSFSETKVTIRVKGGTTGNKYKITALITTSLGNIYERDLIMKVIER